MTLACCGIVLFATLLEPFDLLRRAALVADANASGESAPDDEEESESLNGIKFTAAARRGHARKRRPQPLTRTPHHPFLTHGGLGHPRAALPIPVPTSCCLNPPLRC